MKMLNFIEGLYKHNHLMQSTGILTPIPTRASLLGRSAIKGESPLSHEIDDIEIGYILKSNVPREWCAKWVVHAI